ncbi:D-sedoheptulose 7-phosphate isomerase [candidate division GN15 bacterium]|nr:D-sedoheptulose 7-phosphate isomerase [candidate division GN15 bacterium]
MNDIIRTHLKKHIALVERLLDDMTDDIEAAARLVIDVLRQDKTVFLCGNGGSAADAQHIAAELSGRFLRERRGLSAIALTTDTSALTAIGNDFGFDSIFSRQVEALAREGDLLIGISTSGNSPNVLSALETARSLGCRTLSLSGRDGGQMRVFCELNLIVPADATALIQEMHITIAHIICDLVDREFAG